MKKNKISRLINLEEINDLERSIHRLKKRYNYLKAKNKKRKGESRQMKYIQFHLRKLEA